MYDPSTVAFTISYPWAKRDGFTLGSGRRYHAPFITIWHEDPEDSRGMVARRGDDTCGWFQPPYPPEKRDEIRKLGGQQYSTIFNKQWAVAANKDYASTCYAPSTYDAIYWAWRAIKHHETKRGVWQYDPAPTAAELRHIYELDSNPVDNLRMTEVHDAETCADFFMTVFHCYLRFKRPWYRHPRWHVWHWRFQVHPWQTFRRWALSRCCKCGGPVPLGRKPDDRIVG